MQSNKLCSRKFWMACVTILITLAVGIGYEVDIEALAPIIGAEGALYIVIEGIIDAVRASKGR